ncbi:MAG: Bro-N domain-containing protein [Pseudomonas sp.]|uniref:BRO-N domain-containing protein n=1 Tax=Pseudomonas sp. TaxID=306 RepID=UPI003D113972
MDDAFSPLVLMRHHYPLRGVMIDNQPWVCAREFALLIGHRHPERICRLMDADQVRTVPLRSASGQVEVVEVISESGLYRVLCRFTHPENRNLRRWLSHVAMPTLRDTQGGVGDKPRRTLMAWEKQQINLLDWQGELWIPLSELPSFHGPVQHEDNKRRSLLSRWWRRESRV